MLLPQRSLNAAGWLGEKKQQEMTLRSDAGRLLELKINVWKKQKLLRRKNNEDKKEKKKSLPERNALKGDIIIKLNNLN